MRYRGIFVSVLISGVLTTSASTFAQYGLYGAPSPIAVPTAPAAAAPVNPSVPPTANAVPSAAQPAAVVQPVLVYSYPVANPPLTAYPTAGQTAKPAVLPQTQSPAQNAAPAYPTTMRPIAVPMVAMHPAPSGIAHSYAVPMVPAPYVAGENPPATGVTAPAAPIEEPPLTPIAPSPTPTRPTIQPPKASPSPSDLPRNPAHPTVPQPAPSDNLINSMLSPTPMDYTASGCGYGSYGCPPSGSYYSGACSQFEQAACGRTSNWYASALVLVMGRDKPNGFWSSYESGNQPNQLFKTDELENAWQWGGEITFGRRFCWGCQWLGLQASYWTLSPNTSEVTVTHASGVSTPLTIYPCRIAGADARDWFDGAAAHRLSRRNEYHNIEVSLVGFRSEASEYQSVCGIDWLMGFRFFRFEEALRFASLRAGGSWNVPTQWAAINDHVENNLWGFQIGAHGDLRMTQSVKLFCTPKFGIYNNHIENTFAFYRGDGVAADTNGTYPMGYPVQSSKDQLSFLTEINLGVDWQFARNWSVRVGYRLLAATGIALADNQVPPYVVDIPEIQRIDTNGHLILHGAFAGLTYNY